MARGSIERYQQYAGSALVLGGQVTVVRDDHGAPTAVIGNYYGGLPTIGTTRVSGHAAAQAVERLTGSSYARRIDLVLDPSNGRVFHRIESRRFAERWFHWIDAVNGGVIRAYDGIEAGSGSGVKGDTKDLTGATTFEPAAAHGAGGAHYDLQSTDGRQVTLDAQNRQALLYFVTDTDDSWDVVTEDRQSPGHPALIDAQYYARVADGFYLSTLSFDWIACTGLPAMQSVAHYKRDYDNAFWSGSYLIYGDGDGVTSREYSGGLDVVAHESAHAVTDCTSALIYADESGALNESFSDVVGTSAEFFAAASGLDPTVSPDWFVGEDIMLESDAAPGFRNMANPSEDADPDHYSERQIGGVDNGGVHTNSGIPNHAFYLLVNGGQNAGCPGHPHCAAEGAVTVSGIGLSNARNIFFTGFASLPENATMCQARAATAAVSGVHTSSVVDAWRAVGLTDALCAGATPTSTPTQTTTLTLTPTPTRTATPTPTPSPTPTPTHTVTLTLTSTATLTASPSSTATPTHTFTFTLTPTQTIAATPTPPADSDGDGCADERELGPEETFGGKRDPADFWDFFDVTNDQVIDVEDVLLILIHFGHAHDTDGVDPLIDRSILDPLTPWRTSATLPEAAGIDVGDALVNLQSFGHSCA